MTTSSHGVDKYLEKFLPDVGYAVEVGANDGEFFSNTKHFEDKGWTVLCVEPNPDLEHYGRANRKLWRTVACGAEDAEGQEFGIYGERPWASYSSLGRESRLGGGVATVTITVPVRRLDRVLEEAGFPRLDLLCIDVEGWELEVLKGFDVRRWHPKAIVIEDFVWGDWCHKPKPGYDLEFSGYEEHPKLGHDRIFVRTDSDFSQP